MQASKLLHKAVCCMTIDKTLRDVLASQNVDNLYFTYNYAVFATPQSPQSNAAAALMMPNCKERSRPTCDQHQ
jgi:hypothetical protein